MEREYTEGNKNTQEDRIDQLQILHMVDTMPDSKDIYEEMRKRWLRVADLIATI